MLKNFKPQLVELLPSRDYDRHRLVLKLQEMMMTWLEFHAGALGIEVPKVERWVK